MNIQNSTKPQHLLQQRLFENQSPFEVLKPYEIDLLMVYPELFTRMDRQRILRVLERDGERVSEGDEPLEYWVYRESESRPTISEKSQLTLDIWTSKDEQTPLLVLGDGIIEETVLQHYDQRVRHRVVIPDSQQGLSILVQNTSGSVVWEGQLFPNPKQDHIEVVAGKGPRMRLKQFDSPATLPSGMLLIGGMWLTLGLGVRWLRTIP